MTQLAISKPRWNAEEGYSIIRLPGGITRLAIMLAPNGRGSFEEQAEELFTGLKNILEEQSPPAIPTITTVFMADMANVEAYQRLSEKVFGRDFTVVTFVHQPPCCGAALAIEAWAVSGDTVRISRQGSNLMTVAYNSLRWVYCGGIAPKNTTKGIYEQSADSFGEMKQMLEKWGVDFDNVVRTWLYLGDIVADDGPTQNYRELNRARTDFFRGVQFGRSLLMPGIDRGAYPASTGIGTRGARVVMSCMALDTRRPDVFLLPLENPDQTPAYDYGKVYSPQSPKFSRAMAVILGNYFTVWISGTASIVDSETVFLDDAAKQTEQTIDNIEQLIGEANFRQHGVPGTGATLADLAKVRVYVKRPQDYQACREVCERRFGNIPVIYAVADVCRPDLLVEIEGVAFAKRHTTASLEPVGSQQEMRC